MGICKPFSDGCKEARELAEAAWGEMRSSLAAAEAKASAEAKTTAHQMAFKRRRQEQLDVDSMKRAMKRARICHQPLTFTTAQKAEPHPPSSSGQCITGAESDSELQILDDKIGAMTGEIGETNVVGMSPRQIAEAFAQPLHVFVKGMKDPKNRTAIAIGASFGPGHPNNFSRRAFCCNPATYAPEKLDLTAVVLLLTYLEQLGMKDWQLRIYTSSAVDCLEETEFRIRELKEKCRLEIDFGTIDGSAEPLQDAVSLAEQALPIRKMGEAKGKNEKEVFMAVDTIEDLGATYDNLDCLDTL